MDDYRKMGGPQVSSINSSNANHRHLLRDYYVILWKRLAVEKIN